MPTERFYRLPKEKAEIIRNAAIREFKRVSPVEASINRIVQEADISRGSFYTYFEDKYDLLEWLMGDFIGNYRRFYVEGLKEQNGNIWNVLDEVLESTIKWLDEQGLVEIVGNMIKGNQFSEQMGGSAPRECKIERESRMSLEEMYQILDKESCSLEMEEFEELMKMHLATLVFSLKAHYKNEKSLEEIKASYRRCMKLLRYGACPVRN